MIDKRTYFRKALEVEGWVADILGNTWTSVTLLDISMGGAVFITPEQLSNGSTRMLRFALPDDSELLVFTARIANCTKLIDSTGYRVGVEFIRRDARLTDIIARFTQAPK